MEVARRFGENLRRLRKGADVSQEELGLRCSLHRTEIGLLERGARVPRIDTLIKLASGLGVRNSDGAGCRAAGHSNGDRRRSQARARRARRGEQ